MHMHMHPAASLWLSLLRCSTIEGIDDVKEFDEVSKAMLTVGLSAEDAACVWQCVAALMLLLTLTLPLPLPQPSCYSYPYPYP